MNRDQAILEALAKPDEPQLWADPRGRVGPSIRQRLMQGMRQEGECWIVTSQPSQKYPNISVLGRMLTRHRVMFFITHGRWPIGGLVRHSCDRSWCISPDHLLEGTHADNVLDAVERSRYASGARKTHCLRNHERTPDNLYSNGECKTCAKDRSKARHRNLPR